MKALALAAIERAPAPGEIATLPAKPGTARATGHGLAGRSTLTDASAAGQVTVTSPPGQPQTEPDPRPSPNPALSPLEKLKKRPSYARVTSVTARDGAGSGRRGRATTR